MGRPRRPRGVGARVPDLQLGPGIAAHCRENLSSQRKRRQQRSSSESDGSDEKGEGGGSQRRDERSRDDTKQNPKLRNYTVTVSSNAVHHKRNEQRKDVPALTSTSLTFSPSRTTSHNKKNNENNDETRPKKKEEKIKTLTSSLSPWKVTPLSGNAPFADLAHTTPPSLPPPPPPPSLDRRCRSTRLATPSSPTVTARLRVAATPVARAVCAATWARRAKEGPPAAGDPSPLSYWS